jgi:hypothetical protein
MMGGTRQFTVRSSAQPRDVGNVDSALFENEVRDHALALGAEHDRTHRRFQVLVDSESPVDQGATSNAARTSANAPTVG